MVKFAWLYGLVALGVLLAACAPSGTQGNPSNAAAGASEVRTPKQLTLVVNNEPGNLISLMEGGGAGPSGVREAVQHHLAEYDDVGQVRPQLAIDLPSTATGTWLVRPDGTMQTNYRLRPNVTWHDGTPLTTADFVFALTVRSDRGARPAPALSRLCQADLGRSAGTSALLQDRQLHLPGRCSGSARDRSRHTHWLEHP